MLITALDYKSDTQLQSEALHHTPLPLRRQCCPIKWAHSFIVLKILASLFTKNIHITCFLKMPKRSKLRIFQKYLFLPVVPKTCKLSFYQTLNSDSTIGSTLVSDWKGLPSNESSVCFKDREGTELRRERQRILSSRTTWATQQDPAITTPPKVLRNCAVTVTSKGRSFDLKDEGLSLYVLPKRSALS